MSNIRIAFYTEAGTNRGMGHLVRSYCIYEKFKSAGIESQFYVDSDINFDRLFNDLNYFKWVNLSIEKKYDIIFIDSYQVGINVYNIISENSKVSVFIDDYNRLNYPKGIILNFAADAQEFYPSNLKNENDYILGLKYIPIREEFIGVKHKKKNQIFIMIGGLDIKNLSLKIIHILKDINIHKVIVINNPLSARKFKKFRNVKILQNPSNKILVKEMAQSRLAISTASMTSYELSYLNIPSIIISISKDQNIGADKLIKFKIATSYIDIQKYNWLNHIKNSVKTLLNNTPNKTYNKIDSLGTQRIFDKTMELLNYER